MDLWPLGCRPIPIATWEIPCLKASGRNVPESWKTLVFSQNVDSGLQENLADLAACSWQSHEKMEYLTTYQWYQGGFMLLSDWKRHDKPSPSPLLLNGLEHPCCDPLKSSLKAMSCTKHNLNAQQKLFCTIIYIYICIYIYIYVYVCVIIYIKVNKN